MPSQAAYMLTFPPVIATVPRWLPFDEMSLSSVCMPSPQVDMIISSPDPISTESLPLRALFLAVTLSVMFLTERSFLLCIPLLYVPVTDSEPLPDSLRSHTE